MAVINYIDGPNRLIYLHADTVGSSVHPMDMYREMRALRRTDEALRKYDVFLRADGNVPKGSGKFTERYVTCLDGTRIVPFDTSHSIEVTGTIISDEGTEGIDLFDRSMLTPTSLVDISYHPPQVEVIVVTVNTGSGVTEQDKLDIAGAVWDEELKGSTHNIPTSAGRRLRQVGSSIIWEGTAIDAGFGPNQIILDDDAADYNGAYDPAMIYIIDGTGIGQTRMILEYQGPDRRAIIDRDWKIAPDNTSTIIISAHPGREHVNEGLARGATANTITLNTSASPDNDSYVGQIVFIRSGAGEDQSKIILSYDGTTKVAVVEHDWAALPDVTSGYIIMPNRSPPLDHMGSAVWASTIETPTAGTYGYLMTKVLTLAKYIGLK